MTLRRRLQLSFALVALVAGGVGLTGFLQSRRLEGDAAAINRAGRQRMRAYRLATLATHYASFRDLVTGEAIETELARFRGEHESLVQGEAPAGLKPPPDRRAADALQAAGTLFDLYERQVRRLVSRVDAGEAELDLDSQAVVALAQSVAESMELAVKAYEVASARAVTIYGRIQLGLFLTAVAVALFVFAVVHRAIVRDLPALVAGLGEVAEGRLGARVDLGRGRDEFGRLGEAFNRMSAELEGARETVEARERELTEKNRELARADEMKTRFLRTMSHELRTPLTSIIGFTDLLLRGVYGSLEEKQRARLETIVRNARHLLAIIGDILDLAKIDAGKMTVRLGPVEPRGVLEATREVLEPLAETKGLSLRVEAPPDLACVWADPDRLRQVLLNFGSNAVKFTEAGSVALRAVAVPEARAVRFEVEDTGAGIPREKLGKLFEPFEQLDNSATRRHGGTGLGLHIARRMAELMSARIEVESEPGRGSLFAITVPTMGAKASATNEHDRTESESEEETA